MLTPQDAQARVTELESELAQLNAALRELEQQLDETAAKRDAAVIVSERTPTPQHARQADQLDAATRLLESQVGRKRTAIAAAKVDLDQARNDLQAAQSASVVVELENMVNDYAAAIAKLEENPLLPAEWERLALIAHRGNRLYSQVRPTTAREGRTIFLDTEQIAARVRQRITATISAAVDLRKLRQWRVDYATVADAADLPKLQREVAHLRRLHIEPVAHTAQEAVLV